MTAITPDPRTMIDYDWQRLQGLGFDLDYIEETSRMRKKLSDYRDNPMDEMVIAPHLDEEPGKNRDTFFLSEHGDDAFQSTQPNGGMISTQLKIALEKVEILLSLVEPEDNFEPWVATKINNAAVGLASVADYLRFGGET